MEVSIFLKGGHDWLFRDVSHITSPYSKTEGVKLCVWAAGKEEKPMFAVPFEEVTRIYVLE